MTGRSPGWGWGDRRRAGLVACATLTFVGVWAGCTVTPENYEFLSKIFDGVPDPSHPEWEPGPDGRGSIRKSPTYTIHQPYAEEKCVDCHGSAFRQSSLDSSICLKCHEGIPESQPRMHGPVVTVACLWCHTPHESPYAALFKAPPREVCSSCHAPGMLGTDRTPEHLPDSEASCLECHQGHGGTVRYFLRQSGHGMSEPAAPAEIGGDSSDRPPAPVEGAAQGESGPEP